MNSTYEYTLASTFSTLRKIISFKLLMDIRLLEISSTLSFSQILPLTDHSIGTLESRLLFKQVRVVLDYDHSQ